MHLWLFPLLGPVDCGVWNLDKGTSKFLDDEEKANLSSEKGIFDVKCVVTLNIVDF